MVVFVYLSGGLSFVVWLLWFVWLFAGLVVVGFWFPGLIGSVLLWRFWGFARVGVGCFL